MSTEAQDRDDDLNRSEQPPTISVQKFGAVTRISEEQAEALLALRKANKEDQERRLRRRETHVYKEVAPADPDELRRFKEWKARWEAITEEGYDAGWYSGGYEGPDITPPRPRMDWVPRTEEDGPYVPPIRDEFWRWMNGWEA